MPSPIPLRSTASSSAAEPCAEVGHGEQKAAAAGLNWRRSNADGGGPLSLRVQFAS